MKRILSVLLILLLLAGCSGKPTKEENAEAPIAGDPCDFLIQCEWEGHDGYCVNTIRFNEDFSFSNFCGCGDPIGFADLIESFRYRASDQAILLYDGSDKLLETGKVIYVDTNYLVVNLFDTIYCYENLGARQPKIPDNLTDMAGISGLTFPYVSIIDYDNGALEVAHYKNGETGGTAVLKTAADMTLMFLTPNETGGYMINTPTVEDIGKEGLPTHGLMVLDQDGNVSALYLYDQQ